MRGRTDGGGAGWGIVGVGVGGVFVCLDLDRLGFFVGGAEVVECCAVRVLERARWEG